MARALTIRLPEGPYPPPAGANYFHLSFNGPDIQLLVGYFDLMDVARAELKAKASAKSIEVIPEITHRFAISARSLHMLRRQVVELAAKLEEQLAQMPPEDLRRERMAEEEHDG